MKSPRITDVEPLEERWLRLSFSDGAIVEVDVGPLLVGPVFERIRVDSATFGAVKLDPELGTVVWGNEADLDPDVLYGHYEPDPPVAFARRVVRPAQGREVPRNAAF
jgi:hypothetical protein